jgi:hypothetical protein
LIDVVMSDEDRVELAKLQRQVHELTEQRKAALAKRNGFMNMLFNSWRADIHEITKTVGMRRQNVHEICRGPRTGTRRPLTSRRWLRSNSEEES